MSKKKKKHNLFRRESHGIPFSDEKVWEPPVHEQLIDKQPAVGPQQPGNMRPSARDGRPGEWSVSDEGIEQPPARAQVMDQLPVHPNVAQSVGYEVVPDISVPMGYGTADMVASRPLSTGVDVERSSPIRATAPPGYVPPPKREEVAVLVDEANARHPWRPSLARMQDEREFQLFADGLYAQTLAAVDVANVTDEYQEWLFDQITIRFEALFKRMRSHASNRRARTFTTVATERIPPRHKILGSRRE